MRTKTVLLATTLLLGLWSCSDGETEDSKPAEDSRREKYDEYADRILEENEEDSLELAEMGSSYFADYQYGAFILPDSDFDLETLEEVYREMYAKEDYKVKITNESGELVVQLNDWMMRFELVQGTRLRNEVVTVMEVAEDPRISLIEPSVSVLFITEEGEDPDMDFFNESLMMLHELARFKKVAVFQPFMLEIIDEFSSL